MAIPIWYLVLSTIDTVGSIFYVLDYDQANSVASARGTTAVGIRHFGNELDVNADWAATSRMSRRL